MESIRGKVAIIGMGCTKFGELWDKATEDLIVDACSEAFEDAGIKPTDIQAAWYATQFSGLSGQPLTHALKLEYVPVTRVENFCATGTDAFRNACYAVAGGMCDVALVCGAEKLKDSGFAGLPTVAERPGFTPSRVTPEVSMPGVFAMAATRYFHKYGLSYEEGKKTLAKIAVKNHQNGAKCPRSHFQKEITLEQAVSAPMVAWPLGLFDCCGMSDGAAAAIITPAEIARKFREDYVLVDGLGLTCGAMQGQLQQGYDYVHFEETVAAARMAYDQAGIKDPREEIDLAVVHDCFTITELINCEDLGFSPRGKAKEDVDSGFFALGGGLPVNTDGGLKCFGHPIGATGLRMLYEVYKQLQGKAGARQVKDADTGLTHNLGGTPGCFTGAVSILRRRS